MSGLLPDKPILGVFTPFPILLILGIFYTLALIATMATSKNVWTKILAQITPCIMFTACLGFFPKPAFPAGSIVYLGLLIVGLTATIHFISLAEGTSSQLARARYHWAAAMTALAITSFCGYGFLQLFIVTKAELCLTVSNAFWLLSGIGFAYCLAAFGHYTWLALRPPKRLAEHA